MAFFRGPNVIVDSSLVLHLDAANNKSLFPSVEVLVVAGGGGGGGGLGGGGGGGSVIKMPNVLVISTDNVIVVGDGGDGSLCGGYPSQTYSSNGQDSSAFGAIAKGGGGSGNYSGAGGTVGGCGGGAAANDGSLGQGGPVSTESTLGGNSGTIYGNRGGNMTAARTGDPTKAAGGGGAGGQGIDTNSNTTGDAGLYGDGAGGIGIESSILGTSYYWAGGGGGGTYVQAYGGYGGLGGGGGGGAQDNTHGPGGGMSLNIGGNGGNPGGAGGTNTGGGGGGSLWEPTTGGKGGSGIVVVRYRGMRRATGGIVTTVGEYTVHTFLTGGTFTPMTTNGTNTWIDLSGNNNNGTLTNGPTFNADNMGSLVFDGIDDYVTVPNSSDLNLTAYGTVSVWFYHSSNTSEDFGGLIGIAPDGNTAGGSSYVMFWSAAYGNVIRASISDLAGNINVVIMGIPRFKMWCNCTYTWDGTTLTMYRDGISVDTAVQTVNAQILISALEIGRSFSYYCFPGYISNTSVYNRALSASEVLQNYNALKSRFEERIVLDGLVLNLDAGKPASYPGTGTSWVDLSGKGNNGTLANGVGYNSANAGSIVFDGVNDYVNVPANVSIRPDTAITLESFAYLTPGGTWQSIIQSPYANGGHISPFYDYNLQVNLDGSMTTGINGYFIFTPVVFNYNRWNHFVVTWTNGNIIFYVNGINVYSTTNSQYTITYENNTNILISGNASHGELVNGNIAIARIYNRALSAAEVLQNYDQTKHRFI